MFYTCSFYGNVASFSINKNYLSRLCRILKFKKLEDNCLTIRIRWQETLYQVHLGIYGFDTKHINAASKLHSDSLRPVKFGIGTMILETKREKKFDFQLF